MPIDAILNTPRAQSPITTLEIEDVSIDPKGNRLSIRIQYLREDGASGGHETIIIDGAEFGPAMLSFCQVNPKRKVLTWLLQNNKLPGITVS